MNPNPTSNHQSRPRAAVYIWESKDYLLAIDHQIRAAVAKAEEEGYHVPDSPLFRFSDNDRTGKNSGRDDFSRLFRLVENGQAEFVRIYTPDMSRSGRWDDFRIRMYHEVSLEAQGVVVRYCDEEEPVDYARASGDHMGARAHECRQEHQCRQGETSGRARESATPSGPSSFGISGRPGRHPPHPPVPAPRGS